MEFVIVFIKNGIFVVAGTLSYVSYTCQQIENLSKSIQNINKKHTALLSHKQGNQRLQTPPSPVLPPRELL